MPTLVTDPDLSELNTEFPPAVITTSLNSLLVDSNKTFNIKASPNLRKIPSYVLGCNPKKVISTL